MSSDRRSKLDYATPPRDPRNQPTPPAAMAAIRYTLMLSGVAMLAMAGLTFAGVMFYPQRWIGIMFLMVAFADLLIGLVVFGKRRPTPP